MRHQRTPSRGWCHVAVVTCAVVLLCLCEAVSAQQQRPVAGGDAHSINPHPRGESQSELAQEHPVLVQLSSRLGVRGGRHTDLEDLEDMDEDSSEPPASASTAPPLPPPAPVSSASDAPSSASSEHDERRHHRRRHRRHHRHHRRRYHGDDDEEEERDDRRDGHDMHFQSVHSSVQEQHQQHITHDQRQGHGQVNADVAAGGEGASVNTQTGAQTRAGFTLVLAKKGWKWTEHTTTLSLAAFIPIVISAAIFGGLVGWLIQWATSKRTKANGEYGKAFIPKGDEI